MAAVAAATKATNEPKDWAPDAACAVSSGGTVVVDGVSVVVLVSVEGS